MTARRTPHIIDVTVPASEVDPRAEPAPPQGVRVHRSPSLHPEDTVTLPNGLRVTSVARTLVDLAEEMSYRDLHNCFAAARDRELLDMEALRRCRARVEWRPSLELLDRVIAEFEPR